LSPRPIKITSIQKRFFKEEKTGRCEEHRAPGIIVRASRTQNPSFPVFKALFSDPSFQRSMTKYAEKKLLRSRLLEARRSLPFEEVFSLSKKAQRRLLGTRFFRDSGRLALYSSFANEVLTDEVFKQAVEAGKEVFYPRVSLEGIRFLRVKELDELTPGAYDLREPTEGFEAAGPESFDLIVIPGVAFDESGGRIGFGKGHYDMALKGATCPIVALAYEFQVLKTKIPIEPHDVYVSAIITEERTVVTGALRGRKGEEHDA